VTSRTREALATVAESLARKPYHGNTTGLRSNLQPIIDHFPKGPRSDFDGKWCAAFVYHCCVEAGYDLPYGPGEDRPCNFAGVKAWLYWAKLPHNRFYFARRNRDFTPERGDIVIYDNVFMPCPHDHIGIVLAVSDTYLTVAEGNVSDISAVVQRPRNSHIRGYIRIPDGYRYRES
jgi:CHAP domain-containing protein